MEWQTLGATAPAALADTRVQLHWAAQVLSAAADGWLEARGDDSHTAMEWDRARGALVGQPTAAGARLALRVADLTLVGRDELPLAGRTLADAMAWADRELAAAAGAEPRGLTARDYDMPAHPVASAMAPFAPDPDALAELARWYADGDLVLREIAGREPDATAVRCWPHHFDIAAILYLERDRPAESARQIGFGLSPGDEHHPEPYFYLTPWPIEIDVTFPPLPSGGRWQRAGFTGAVLLASSLLQGPPDRQLERVRAWFDAAFAIGRGLISRAGR
jgi:hypothetical protein